MPNYYAHLTFGRRVLQRLPALPRSVLAREESAFLVGCLGPDPLFFYRPLIPSAPRAAGIELHHASFRAPAEALLELNEAQAPFAGSYAAGFLCHFALDSACHPLVDRAMAGGVSHSAVESELDRALMSAQGLDPLTRTPLPEFELPVPFFSTAASLFPGVSPEAFSEALASFRRICRLQTRAAGTWAWKTVDRLGNRFPLLSALQGSVLTPRPDPACVPAARALLARLEEEVAPTAQAIMDFFSAVRSGGVLGPWYDRDFYGNHAPGLVTA